MVVEGHVVVDVAVALVVAVAVQLVVVATILVLVVVTVVVVIAVTVAATVVAVEEVALAVVVLVQLVVVAVTIAVAAAVTVRVMAKLYRDRAVEVAATPDHHPVMLCQTTRAIKPLYLVPTNTTHRHINTKHHLQFTAITTPASAARITITRKQR